MKFNDSFWDRFAELSLSGRALFDFLAQQDQERVKRLDKIPHIELLLNTGGVYEKMEQSLKEDFLWPIL